jgi:hypothetical protein
MAWAGKKLFFPEAVSPHYCFWLFIATHITVWTLCPIIAESSVTIHHDMTEAWSWGKEFQLGYYKHPPFYAWIVGLWFHIFPREDWYFNLLSSLNIAIGLIGVWFVAGRFLSGWTRLGGVLLLTLTPFYNLMAFNYNANSILLSAWPWTVYFFVRSLETSRARDGALFGAMAAVSLLCKYFSALLIVACFSASILHPNARRYYKTSAPYVAITIFFLLMAPHVWWGITNEWPTVHYALKYLPNPYGMLLLTVMITTLSTIGLHTIALIAVFACFRSGTLELLKQAVINLSRRENIWLALLAFGPFVLTLLSGLAGIAKISTRFMIPVFFMVPIVLLKASCVELVFEQIYKITRIWKMLAITALALSPFVAIATFAYEPDAAKEPRRELAVEVTRMWREKLGLPLRIAAGSQAYGHGIAFYSPDGPSEFIDLRLDFSPWISASRISREGLLVACLVSDHVCLESALRFATLETCRFKLTMTRTFLGRHASPAAFEIFMIPPRMLSCQSRQ